MKLRELEDKIKEMRASGDISDDSEIFLCTPNERGVWAKVGMAFPWPSKPDSPHYLVFGEGHVNVILKNTLC